MRIQLSGETTDAAQSRRTDWDPNDRVAIEAGLSDLHNPIALALAVQLKDLTARYRLYAEVLGYFSTEFVLVRPKTAFDETTCWLHLMAIADATDRAVTVVWVDDDMPTNQSSL